MSAFIENGKKKFGQHKIHCTMYLHRSITHQIIRDIVFIMNNES